MRRVLIASDDAHTAALVRQALEGLDATLSEATMSELRLVLTRDEPHLVVADGGRDPEAVAQLVEQLAATGADVALVLLVGPESLDSLRLPVRLPSDFVVRGASASEIAARARALLWPGEEVTKQELVRVDDLTLNLATYQAHIHGEPIEFTYQEYALFAFLVTHPGRTYSREALLRRVWGSDYYGGSRTVDVHIRRIRSKLGPDFSRRLETVRNVGYLWSV